MEIYIVGAGLAGSECALQLAHAGFVVHLYEMRGSQDSSLTTPAHKTNLFAELVCSNSLGSLSEASASGQMKWEAKQLNSFVLNAALQSSIPAGQALGVDRIQFANLLTQQISNHPNIIVHHEFIENLEDLPRPLVLATGPLTHERLAESIQKHFINFGHEQFLSFFDAIAPIIDADSIKDNIVWKADRYDKGTPDYINCPLEKDQYFAFITALKEARKIEPKDFEKTPFFEGCMPIEAMLERGPQTLRFGPMKPVGLINPKTGKTPYAVVQLRQENKEATSYNMVGFQTRMAYADQVRVFRMIPGLENAEFLKLGSMHRNLFIKTPLLLNKNLSSKNDDELFFAGQITGVEGYFESTCIGLLVAHIIHHRFQNYLKPEIQKVDPAVFKSSQLSLTPLPPRETALGSLLNAITDEHRLSHFQPINMNMGLLPPLEQPPKDKNEKKQMQIQLAKNAFVKWRGSPSNNFTP